MKKLLIVLIALCSFATFANEKTAKTCGPFGMFNLSSSSKLISAEEFKQIGNTLEYKARLFSVRMFLACTAEDSQENCQRTTMILECTKGKYWDVNSTINLKNMDLEQLKKDFAEQFPKGSTKPEINTMMISLSGVTILLGAATETPLFVFVLPLLPVALAVDLALLPLTSSVYLSRVLLSKNFPKRVSKALSNEHKLQRKIRLNYESFLGFYNTLMKVTKQ